MENIRGFDALLKSREYVRGKFIPVAWRHVFIGLVLLLPILLISLLLNFVGISSESPVASAVSVVFGLVALPLMMSYGFLVYLRLKELRGDFSFAPTKETKAGYMAMGIVGALIVFAALFVLPWLLLSGGEKIGIGSISGVQDSLDQSRAAARNAKRKSDLKRIRLALEIYFDQKQEFPENLNELSSMSDFPFSVPTDPAGASYRYEKIYVSYRLCATLEKGEEFCEYPEKANDDSKADTVAPATNNTFPPEEQAAGGNSDQDRLNRMSQISFALEIYFDKYGKYPVALSDLPPDLFAPGYKPDYSAYRYKNRYEIEEYILCTTLRSGKEHCI